MNIWEFLATAAIVIIPILSYYLHEKGHYLSFKKHKIKSRIELFLTHPIEGEVEKAEQLSKKDKADIVSAGIRSHLIYFTVLLVIFYILNGIFGESIILEIILFGITTKVKIFDLIILTLWISFVFSFFINVNIKNKFTDGHKLYNVFYGKELPKDKKERVKIWLKIIWYILSNKEPKV